MIVLVAVMLVILLFMVAFSIDVAFMQLTRTELRAATDAAARAAAGTLAREQLTGPARAEAKRVARLNLVAGEPLHLADGDVIFGNSRFTNTGVQAFVPGGAPTNATRVNGRRTDSAPSGAVPLFLGSIFGVNRFQPVQTAVAAKMDRDIYLVLDHSGSMGSQNRWPDLLAAVDVFMSELANTPQVEHVGIVGYSTTAALVHPLSADLAAVQSSLDSLSPDGWTAIGEGLLLASDRFLVDPLSRTYAAKTIVVMTDGNHNTGVSPDITVETAAEREQIVHTITFSDGANQALMQDVATQGNGIHIHAPNGAALKDAFKTIALTLPVITTE
jgi:uncharacterized protein YegL